MPTYSYECSKGHHFDLKLSFHESSASAECPTCRASARRLFHAPPVIYKGSGFYTTDYARKSSSSSEGASAASDSSD